MANENSTVISLVEKASKGDRRSVGRLLTLVERGGAAAEQVAEVTHNLSDKSHVFGLLSSIFLHGLAILASDTTYHCGAVSSTGLGRSGCIISISIGLDTISTFFVPKREHPLIAIARIGKII